MSNDITYAPAKKAITEGQLLKHLLDAPYRTGPSSALFKEKCSDSLRYALFGHFFGGPIEDDLPFRLLDALCESENPVDHLRQSITLLEDWLAGLRTLDKEYSFVRNFSWSNSTDNCDLASNSETGETVGRRFLPEVGGLGI